MVLLKQIGTEVEFEKSAHQSNSKQKKTRQTGKKSPSTRVAISLTICCIIRLHLYLLRFVFSFLFFFVLFHFINENSPIVGSPLSATLNSICSRSNFQCSHFPFSIAFQIANGILALAFHFLCQKDSGYK